MNLIMLIALAGLMHAARSFGVGHVAGSSGTSLAVGYMLVTGYFAGALAAKVRLPKLTGYLLVGMLVGPSALALVSRSMLENLNLVNGMAVAMIALTAGSELEFARVRPLLRTVAAITLIAVLGTTVLLTFCIFSGRALLPFLARMEVEQALSVAAVLGIVVVAQSPAVVVALRDELRADGPVARTALAVVVLADLVVIFMFAVLSTVSKALLGASANVGDTVATLAWEIGGSLLAGSFVGLVLMLYLGKVKDGTPLFLLAVTFIIAEIGGRLGFDPLLVALAAGALVRNASPHGDLLHEELQISALPVYVLFFCMAGATLHLAALPDVWLPATAIVLVRASGLLLGTNIAARVAGASPAVRRYAGFGLLPQAGLALALSMLFSRTFPEFGAHASALTLSVVAINELLAPIAYRIALERSGEVGREAVRAQPTSSWPPSLERQ
jgi:Kef-type K+ transport system membrane component KefB